MDPRRLYPVQDSTFHFDSDWEPHKTQFRHNFVIKSHKHLSIVELFTGTGTVLVGTVNIHSILIVEFCKVSLVSLQNIFLIEKFN